MAITWWLTVGMAATAIARPLHSPQTLRNGTLTPTTTHPASWPLASVAHPTHQNTESLSSGPQQHVRVDYIFDRIEEIPSEHAGHHDEPSHSLHDFERHFKQLQKEIHELEIHHYIPKDHSRLDSLLRRLQTQVRTDPHHLGDASLLREITLEIAKLLTEHSGASSDATTTTSSALTHNISTTSSADAISHRPFSTQPTQDPRQWLSSRVESMRHNTISQPTPISTSDVARRVRESASLPGTTMSTVPTTAASTSRTHSDFFDDVSQVQRRSPTAPVSRSTVGWDLSAIGLGTRHVVSAEERIIYMGLLHSLCRQGSRSACSTYDSLMPGDSMTAFPQCDPQRGNIHQATPLKCLEIWKSVGIPHELLPESNVPTLDARSASMVIHPVDPHATPGPTRDLPHHALSSTPHHTSVTPAHSPCAHFDDGPFECVSDESAAATTTTPTSTVAVSSVSAMLIAREQTNPGQAELDAIRDRVLNIVFRAALVKHWYSSKGTMDENIPYYCFQQIFPKDKPLVDIAALTHADEGCTGRVVHFFNLLTREVKPWFGKHSREVWEKAAAADDPSDLRAGNGHDGDDVGS